MTTDAAAADLSEHQPLYCYRHPDRETWVRCGRCDQPICSRCAMQGPVGLRCKVCGTPSRDALASMRPTQLAIAAAVSLVGGAVVGYAGSALGIFGLVAAFFGGGLIAEALDRTVGIKRGTRIMVIAVPGIVAGGVAGIAFSLLGFLQQIGSVGAGEDAGLIVQAYLFSMAPFALLAVVVAAGVAATRLR
jgi:hypothetical protein